MPFDPRTAVAKVEPLPEPLPTADPTQPDTVYRVRPVGEVLGRTGSGVRRRGGVEFGRHPVFVSTVAAEPDDPRPVVVVDARDLARILADPMLISKVSLPPETTKQETKPAEDVDGNVLSAPKTADPETKPSEQETKPAGNVVGNVVSEPETEPTTLEVSTKTPNSMAVEPETAQKTDPEDLEDEAAEFVERFNEEFDVDDFDEDQLRDLYEQIYGRKPSKLIAIGTLRDRVANPPTPEE